MHQVLRNSVRFATVVALLATGVARSDDRDRRPDWDQGRGHDGVIQVGPRPAYLVDGMDEGPLKDKLERCENEPVRRTDFSIAHRGAPLQFPEHTREAYV